MIYADNAATSLIKPSEVAQAVAYAINSFGNAGRSHYDSAIDAAREIYNTRVELAKLINLDEPMNIAFTSSSTESLNLVINGLIKPEDSVITTVLEHNSVLRPLYNSGCEIQTIAYNKDLTLDLSSIRNIVKTNTKYLICTHASNVTGTIVDIKEVKRICNEYGLIFILDASQTMGMLNIEANDADIICFTGHKSLFGPQGTGGLVCSSKIKFKPVKTGGAGYDSFKKTNSSSMPDFFEVGTINCHSIYGLQKGINFINKTTLKNIVEKDLYLLNRFISNIKNNNKIKVYGNPKIPVISLNIDNLSSSELSFILWEKYKIATRAGIHCAPMVHKALGTSEMGTTRFSFSYFNNEEEIDIIVNALNNITCNY